MTSLTGSEGQLLTRVMEALSLLQGCRPMRRNSGGRRGRVWLCEEGTPDIEVMLRGGRVAWIELKTATGTVSDAQKLWHAAAGEMGHVVHVVRTVQGAIDAVREEMVT